MNATERRNPKTTHIDQMRPLAIVEAMQEEFLFAVEAVSRAKEQIALVIEKTAERMQNGGRLFYVGCGTSGRLGVLDASECPPTFGVSPDLVVGLIAGGDYALRNAVEHTEDDPEAGKKVMQEHQINGKDVVVGISAAGGAMFVVGALEYAKSVGALSVAVVCNENTKMAACADITIETLTGAEVIQGSTRLKAGTAQKLVLNEISTGAMIRLGMVYENMMINLRPMNEKLERRMCNIVHEVTGIEEDAAHALLAENDWNIKRAVAAYQK